MLTEYGMASQTEENYLKALYHLSSESSGVNVSTLSKMLEVSKPTTNSMMKNLKEKGLVHYEKYKPLQLTEKGRKIAALIVRKHRLTEMFLVDKMGFGWDEVHEIAEQVEHIKSQKFFDRMDELLDHPTNDPHGSPIPDKDGNVPKKKYQPLSTYKPGDTVTLVGLENSSKEFLAFLDKRNLSLGTEIKIELVEPFDGSLQVAYNNESISMSTIACDQLLVELI